MKKILASLILSLSFSGIAFAQQSQNYVAPLPMYCLSKDDFNKTINDNKFIPIFDLFIIPFNIKGTMFMTNDGRYMIAVPGTKQINDGSVCISHSGNIIQFNKKIFEFLGQTSI